MEVNNQLHVSAPLPSRKILNTYWTEGSVGPRNNLGTLGKGKSVVLF